MHGCIQQWLGRALAVAVVCGMGAAAMAQESQSPPPTQYYSVSETANNDNAALSARVAELEKALQKMDEKAKADKEKAASAFSCTPCGRIQVDTAMFSQSGQDNYLGKTYEPNGVEFRRLYIGLKGSGFDVIEYKTEFDLAGTVTNSAANAYPTSTTAAKIQAKDIYLQINELPLLGHVRIGNFYEPFSIEDVSGDLVTTFMERGEHFHVGSRPPHRRDGLRPHFGQRERPVVRGRVLRRRRRRRRRRHGLAGNHQLHGRRRHGPAHLAALVRRSHPRPRFPALGRWPAATARPGAHQFPLASPSLRPEEAHLAQTYAATMNNIDYVEELGTELAFVYGPFSFQSEFVGASARDLSGGTHNIPSCYAYVSYFLTGENRQYDRNTGTITRVKPYENFFRVRDEDGCTHTGKGSVGNRLSLVVHRLQQRGRPRPASEAGSSTTRSA